MRRLLIASIMPLFVLSACENYDVTGRRGMLRPVDAPMETGSIAPVAPPVVPPGSPASDAPQATARAQRDEIRYTSDGRMILPRIPAPPIIDIGENRAALTRDGDPNPE